MWFMNSSKGIFLPLAGHTPSASGASTGGNAVVNGNRDGNYWCTEKYYRFCLEQMDTQFPTQLLVPLDVLFVA